MHTKYGNELNQATDTVINGATGILMVEKWLHGFFWLSQHLRAFILGRISKRYDSQYVIFRTESNDLLCVETSRYAFDHNTWRGFDYGLAMIAYTCFRIW